MQTVTDYANEVFPRSVSDAYAFWRWLKRFHNNDKLGNETKIIVTNLTDYSLPTHGRIYKAKLNRYAYNGVEVAFCYVEEMDVLVVHDPEILRHENEQQKQG
jgi:hypothetical protein